MPEPDVQRNASCTLVAEAETPAMTEPSVETPYARLRAAADSCAARTPRPTMPVPDVEWNTSSEWAAVLA